MTIPFNLDTLPDWHEHAACARPDSTASRTDFFPETRRDHEAAARAKALCTNRCPVAAKCLTAAIKEEANTPADLWVGIRGGLDGWERRMLLAGDGAA